MEKICQMCQTEDALYVWNLDQGEVVLCEECKVAVEQRYDAEIKPIERGIPKESILGHMIKSKEQAYVNKTLRQRGRR